MSDPAAIRASLVDVRNINTDKEVRLELRLPAELAGKVFEAFGWPTKVAPVDVAIARLEAPVSSDSVIAALKDEPHQAFLQMKRCNQAALRCRERMFWDFLSECTPQPARNDQEANVSIYALCEIDSKRELDSDEEAGRRWDDLEARYFCWKHGRR